MSASHSSCKSLYEVSCRELDVKVELAQEVKVVIGCRMTGAGLGSCAVALVWDSAVQELTERIYEEYKEKTDITPEAHVCTIPEGAREVLNGNALY